MKKKIYIALVLFVAASFLFAQAYKGRGKVRGFVYDEEGKPIEGVTVKLYCVKADSGFETKTNKKGEWKALWIRGGTWYIDFYKVGYEPKKIVVELKELSRNPDIEVTLKKVKGLVLSKEILDLLDKGNKLFDQKKYNEAIKVYEEILQKYPDAYIINKNIGNCYFAMEQYDKAEEYYKKVLEKDPNNVDILIAIGNCYMNRGDAETAVKWYNKIKFEQINDPIVLYNLGTIYYNHGRYDMALKYYKRAVELNKKFLDAYYQLGLTYFALNKNKEALEVFKEYLKLDSTSARAKEVQDYVKYLESMVNPQKEKKK